MRYLGLVGLFFVSTCVWAEPETMTMYATLSDPIASFWEVETKGNAPTVMSKGKLVLGIETCSDGSSNGGTIRLLSTAGQASAFTVDTLEMAGSTYFAVGKESNEDGNKVMWKLGELKVGSGGKAVFNGDLIVNRLTLPPPTAAAMEIGVDGTLFLGSEISGTEVIAPDASFSSIQLGQSNNKFVFEGDTGMAGQAQLEGKKFVKKTS